MFLELEGKEGRQAVEYSLPVLCLHFVRDKMTEGKSSRTFFIRIMNWMKTTQQKEGQTCHKLGFLSSLGK
jgi:hypothetical protein